VQPGDTASPQTLLLNPRLATDTAPPTYRARFETTAGSFVIEAHRDWAPRGADRFWNLVRARYYDSVYIHRVNPGIAQFGFHRDPRVNNLWLQRYIGDDPVVQSNTRGTVVFAHAGMNTRSTQLFINRVDNLQYDADRFAPFAEVVEGLETIGNFYGGYGEVAPDGNGPVNGQAAFRGNEWMKEPCRTCERKELDFGGCRCQAFALTGDASNPDPVCTRTGSRTIVDLAIADAAGRPLDYRYRRIDLVTAGS
jgi:peptidyl-prolyl cis-trans isomerase A (cyclophilin A)